MGLSDQVIYQMVGRLNQSSLSEDDTKDDLFMLLVIYFDQ